MATDVTPFPLAAVERTCKRCARPAPDAPRRGVYAGLCAACRSDEGQRRADERRERSVVPEGELEKTVRRLLPAVRRLEKSVDGHRAARIERQNAVGEFNAAIRAVQTAAQRVLNADKMATAKVDERVSRDP